MDDYIAESILITQRAVSDGSAVSLSPVPQALSALNWALSYWNASPEGRYWGACECHKLSALSTHHVQELRAWRLSFIWDAMDIVKWNIQKL